MGSEFCRDMPSLELLPRSSLIKTSRFDHADWNYRPLLGALQRTRFKLVESMLRGLRLGRILEVGYGSGILMPQLKKHCDRLYGIDTHGRNEEVRKNLELIGVDACLVSGDVSSMPFNTGDFDGIVAVSSLEYVQEIETACKELGRVLKPGSPLFVVTPGASPILDSGLRLIGHEHAEENYGNRREELPRVLASHFAVESVRLWPPRVPSWIVVYRAMTFRMPGG